MIELKAMPGQTDIGLPVIESITTMMGFAFASFERLELDLGCFLRFGVSAKVLLDMSSKFNYLHVSVSGFVCGAHDCVLREMNAVGGIGIDDIDLCPWYGGTWWDTNQKCNSTQLNSIHNFDFAIR